MLKEISGLVHHPVWQVRTIFAISLAYLLTLLVTGCAQTSPLSLESTPSVRAKSRGFEIIIINAGRTHFFQNRHPHCLAYTLTGEWDFSLQEAALRTGRNRFVGVSLIDPEALPEDPRIPRPPSGDQVAYQLTKFIAYYQADAEKDWGQPVPVDVSPFPTALPGALLLRSGKVVVTPEGAARALGPVRPKVGEIAKLPDRVIFPFLPGIIMVVTVSDVADARQVLDTLEVTEDPRCWESTIHVRFPGVLGNRNRSYQLLCLCIPLPSTKLKIPTQKGTIYFFQT